MKRRQFIAQAAGVLALPLMRDAHAQAVLETALPQLRDLVGRAPVRIGRVTLELPQLSDNGNSVSLRVSVESPMTEGDHVRSVHLYAEHNPRPNVANFFFGPQSGRAAIATRIRLAGSQRVVAIAHLSDGSYWAAAANVVVTLSACLDES